MPGAKTQAVWGAMDVWAAQICMGPKAWCSGTGDSVVQLLSTLGPFPSRGLSPQVAKLVLVLFSGFGITYQLLGMKEPNKCTKNNPGITKHRFLQ